MNVTLALAQIDPRAGELEANVQLHLQLANAAIEAGASCIVFPELSLTGYYLPNGFSQTALARTDALLQPLVDLSKTIDILFGLALESPDHRIYNAALYLSRGQIVHEHRKVYLPTYGMFEEGKHFVRGEQLSAFNTTVGRVGILICEENWHPSAACLLWVDNAVLFYSLHCSSTPPESIDNPEASAAVCRQINQLYAKLFGCYFIFVNRVGTEGPHHFWGGSEIVDPFGRVEARAKEFEPELLVHTIDTGKIRQARLTLPLRRDEDVHLTLRNLARIVRASGEE